MVVTTPIDKCRPTLGNVWDVWEFDAMKLEACFVSCDRTLRNLLTSANVGTEPGFLPVAMVSCPPVSPHPGCHALSALTLMPLS